MGTIMTPLHPRWEEFTEQLDEALNFQADPETGEYTWECSGEMDFSHATAILSCFTEIDVEDSLRYFTEHGGGCDCEILLNVANDVEDLLHRDL